MERVKTILNVALQICGDIEVAFEPFLPFMSEKLAKILKIEHNDWDMLAKTDIIPAGTQLGEPELLFEKIEDETIQYQLDRLARIKKENIIKNFKPEPVAETIDIDTFAKADLRVGTVLDCQKVKKAKKLLQFSIDDGTGNPRTILSGIAEHYDPATLVGKQVVYIANLAPRKICGIESEGMILSAVNADGSLTVISPSSASTPGAKIG